jgi:hypothetical protein
MNQPPIYSRAVVEMAEERLPDPGDYFEETIVIDVGGVKVGFHRVPIVCERTRAEGCFWKFELIGKADPPKP